MLSNESEMGGDNLLKACQSMQWSLLLLSTKAGRQAGRQAGRANEKFLYMSMVLIVNQCSRNLTMLPEYCNWYKVYEPQSYPI